MIRHLEPSGHISQQHVVPEVERKVFALEVVLRWGRGTQTIIELCLDAGHPEPEFMEQAGAVAIQGKSS